jgi:hypothetical protein
VSLRHVQQVGLERRLNLGSIDEAVGPSGIQSIQATPPFG